MRKIFFVLAGAALLAACDPTDKNDYGCTAQYQGQTACTQLYITEPEGLLAQEFCERSQSADPPGLEGQWEFHPCPATVGDAARTEGYCQVDVPNYLPSATSAKVYFYGISICAAEAACGAGSGEWIGAHCS